MIITHKHYHIVYADTVLPLKEKGDNIHVASLADIGPIDLDRCIEVIAKANPNVTFNTIQYSQNDKKVYFYTDKPILVGAWRESNIRKYDEVTGIDRIIASINQVLESEGNLNTGYISAYDLASIITAINHEEHAKERSFKYKIDADIEYNIGDSASIVIYDFDYENSLLKVGFKRYRTSKWEDITFSKKHGDLRIVEAESIYAKEVLSSCHKDLSDYYDYCLSIKDYKKDWSHNVRSLDGNMRVTASHTGVTIRDNTYVSSKLEINSPSYSSKYSVECNSSKVLEALNNNKNNLFKKVYIKIEDCPEWCKQRVLDFRIEQVKSEIKRLRKQAFWNKLNPFKKKRSR